MTKTRIFLLVSVCSLIIAAMIFMGCKTTAETTVSSVTETTSAAETTASPETTAAAANQDIKIGLTVWTLQDTFTVQLHDGVIKAGKDMGVEIIDLDNEGGKEVDNTRTLLSKEIDGAIMCYWDPNLAKTSIDLLKEKNIPVLAVDVPMPGVGFLGVNNYDVGHKAGSYLADWIIENWGGKIDLLVVINSPTEGEVVAQRFQGQEDAILEKIDYPKDKIEYADGGGWADGALQVTRPILAKYPDAKKIAFVVENDPCVMGITTALQEAGKAENAAMVTLGMPKDAIHLVRDNKMPVVGGVAFFPDNYGVQGLTPLIEVVKLVKAGKNLDEAYKEVIKDEIKGFGQAVFVKTEIINAKNINEFFPE